MPKFRKPQDFAPSVVEDMGCERSAADYLRLKGKTEKEIEEIISLATKSNDTTYDWNSEGC